MASLDEAPVLALASANHTGGPAGIDVADDPDFLYIEAELAKLDSLEAQESAKAKGEDPLPNWFEIEMRAQRLLENKSKDMVLACWYAMALFHRYQYAGLAAGLGLIQAYVTESWDVMFPERPRKKKAQIEAMGERFLVGTMSEWFKTQPMQAGSPAEEFDAVDNAVQRAEAIRDAVAAKMPDDKPDVAKFISALKGFAGMRPKVAAPAAAPSAGAWAPAGGAAPAASGGGGEAFAAPAVADPSSAMTAIYGAVKFLRDADLSNAVPYAVIRAAKWAKITLPPPGEARTTLPTPEGDLTRHSFMMQGGKWDALLKGAEGDFRSNDPLWLDLQRYICAAMANLGPPYETAKKTIMSLTGALVQRLGPGIFELRFKNGTPLCSGETKLWIETECAISTGKSGGGGTAGASNGKLSEAYDKARGMAGSGKLAEALTELNDGLAACAQRRDRLLWRLRIAQLCADAGKHAVAVPLLEQCQADIERHHVEEWEPAVAAEVAHALYRCRKALLALEKQPTPEAKERLSGAFAWLCRLDPPAALALEPNSN